MEFQGKKINLIQCEEHKIPCKYVCLERGCKTDKKIACSECMFEGVHKNHRFQKYFDILQKVSGQYEKYANQDSIFLENLIRKQFEKSRKQIQQKLDEYEDFFLKQLYPVDKNILSRLNPKNLIQSVTNEDISLIEKLDEEIAKPSFPQYITKQIVDKLEQLDEDTTEYTNQKVVEFALLSSHVGDFSNFNGRILLSFQKSHNNTINACELLAPNLLITGSSDGQVKIWEISSKKMIIEFNVNKQIFKFNKIDDKLIVIAASEYILFYDWAQKKQVAELKAHDEDIKDMILIEQNILVTCSSDFSIKSWDILKGLPLKTYEGHSDKVNKLAPLKKLTKTEKEIQQEIKLQKFFQQGTDNTSSVLNNKNKEILQQSQNETFFISCGDDFLIKIWNFNKVECVFQLPGHFGQVNCVANLNEKLIVSGDSEGMVIIWDLVERKALFKLPSAKQEIFQITSLIKITEQIFAVSDEDGYIRIYSLQNMALLFELKGHNNVIKDLKLSFENKIISVGKDRAIIIWE